MQKSIAEEHPELFHYTNAAGLAGIIQSQTLWATHYAYLNDSEEVRFFGKDRLPNLLQIVSKTYLNELTEIDLNGGQEKIIDQFVKEALAALENTLFNNHLAETYITSFCTTKDEDDRVKDHGLLSQWRGYGRDGGYAIVFDTAHLSMLLEKAGNKWKNGSYLFLGNIVYSSDSDQAFLNEFEEDLDVIKRFFSNHLRNIEDSKNLENIFSALMKCACRYKHWGFKEENEVRIIAIPHPTDNEEFREYVSTDGTVLNEIPRKHVLRSSTLVPIIDLFEGITSTPKNPLPIKRIIVGPSSNDQERKRRIRTVELLVAQYGIKDVVASEIPYLGR